MFLAGIIIPQVELITSNVTASELTTTTEIVEPTQTEVAYQQPLDNYQLSQGYQFYHPGIDLRTSYNDPVMAIAKGNVEVATSTNWGYGKYIVLRHENGYASLYAHLSEIIVKEGDVVEKGTTIGNVGTTGWSTGSHLHLEIHGPEGSIDPLEVLPSIETAQN